MRATQIRSFITKEGSLQNINSNAGGLFASSIPHYLYATESLRQECYKIDQLHELIFCLNLCCSLLKFQIIYIFFH